MKKLIVLVFLVSSCVAKPQIVPTVQFTLLQFHGALSNQYQVGGMDIDTFNTINDWIVNEIRVTTHNPKQWEGQARLEWNKIRSLCGPYDSLNEWVEKMNRLIQ